MLDEYFAYLILITGDFRTKFVNWSINDTTTSEGA